MSTGKIDIVKGMSEEERVELLKAFTDKELMEEIAVRLDARKESIKAIREALINE